MILLIEEHVINKQGSEVRKYVISAILKNCKVTVTFDVNL